MLEKKASEMTVDKMVRHLSKAYISLIENGVPFKKFPSVMLWGPPGVGKSQGVRQIAEQIAVNTSRKVDVTDVRLLLFNPVDLRGIPTANADKTLAVWLKPKIFQMNDSADVVNILFLDEISAAPQSVQAAAYQITLDRTVGEHKLPDNCIVIAAGNRVTDRSVAYSMPKALANRLCHFDIIGDDESWHNWAVRSGINSLVLGYLSNSPSMLMQFDASDDGLSFPTPRSWEMVSNILNYVSSDIDEVMPLIIGCIGELTAYDFKMWCRVYGTIPDMESVFNGTASDVPIYPDALFALSSKIIGYAQNHNSKVELENVVDYVNRLLPEFKNRIFNDLLKNEDIRETLSRIRIYDDWFLRTGHYWEDYGL